MFENDLAYLDGSKKFCDVNTNRICASVGDPSMTTSERRIFIKGSEIVVIKFFSFVNNAPDDISWFLQVLRVRLILSGNAR